MTKKRSIVFPDEQFDTIEKYAASRHINFNEAVRRLIDKGLSSDFKQSGGEMIDRYIRDEVDTVLEVLMRQYMERYIRLQAQATRASAASFMTSAQVMSETFIDEKTPEETVAFGLKMAAAFLKMQPKTDEEYAEEARAYIRTGSEMRDDNYGDV